MKKYIRIICAAICAVLCLAMIPAYAGAEDRSAGSLEQMTDTYMQKVLSDYHVAGAAVSVVRGGAVLFQKGYGYADIENKTPVDADTTAFQIASVSKVFTATAVMQMVEQGKLSLDADVNNYLTAFKINNPFPNPVTLRTLLTHTSGLDYRVPGYMPSTGNILFDSIDPLENELKNNLPPMVRNPGSYCQYNPYGTALAGYLVEIASGEPFDRYVTENILTPLEMNHSSYGLTDHELLYLSKPYHYTFGTYAQGTYTVISDHPGGSICTTAADMAHFMIAHLGNGLFTGKKILQTDTAIQMHAHQYPGDVRLIGYSLGFFEGIRNGYTTLEFGGRLPCFSSKISLLPEKNIGVFVAVNTDSDKSGRVCNEYIDMVYKNLTQNQLKDFSGDTFDMDAGAICGSYSFSEYGETDYSKMKSVMLTCSIQCDSNGNLHASSSEFDWNFTYAGEGMFYCRDNGIYCRFLNAGDGWVLNILGADFAKINTIEWLLMNVSVFYQPVLVVAIVLLARSLIKNRKLERKPGCVALGIMLLLQAILSISYYALFAATSFFYTTGNTGPIIHVIGPAIPFVCWSYTGIVVASVALALLRRRTNQVSVKAKTVFWALIALHFINIAFMYSVNGMKF